jgi:Poly-adenylate binding protein, unique domain
VTNYELPEIRRKQQAEAKDKADFMNLKRQSAGPIDPNLLARPDTMNLIQQILFLVQRQMGGQRFPNQGGYNNYNRGPMGAGGPRNNDGRRPYNGQGQQQYNGNRGPRNASQGPYPGQQQPGAFVPQPVVQPPPQVNVAAPAQIMIKDSQGPLVHPDPFINAYNQRGFQIIPAVVPTNPNLKQFVGEFIYEFVEKFVGEDKAPKITGMLIDLPLEEIKGYLFDFFKLQFKIQEAMHLLTQINAGTPQ